MDDIRVIIIVYRWFLFYKYSGIDFTSSMYKLIEHKYQYIHKEFMVQLKKNKLKKILYMLNKIVIPNMTDIIIKYI